MRQAASHGVYACTQFGGVRLEVRVPRLSDAAAWAAARAHNRHRLAPAFTADYGDAREVEQSELAFVERCVRLRQAARRGLAFPALIAAPERDGTLRVLGEIGLDSVDERTRSGEVSAWTGSDLPGARVTDWALAAVLSRAFVARRPLRRVLAPIASANPAARNALKRLGFQLEATLSAHRRYGGALADHEVWVLQNTPESRSSLRVLLARLASGDFV